MTTPSPELDALLAGPSRWHTLEHHAEVTSTNDLVAAAAAAGTPPGLVATADRQTAGRGRRGRVWRDQPAGRSLAVSALVAAPAEHATLVPLAAGVAVADAYRRSGGRAVLKWPNDVLLPAGAGPAKAAGILVERHGDHVVVGMGLNLDWRGVDRDEETGGWTSLAEAAGVEVDRWRVLADLLRALDAWLGDLAGDPVRLLASYRSRCATLGRRVRVATGDGTSVEGEAVAVADDGALEVATTGGRVRVTVGDVAHVR